MDAETKLLLEIWSKDTIKRQLKGAFRNVNIVAQVMEDLQKSGYYRMVQQYRIKIKSLKKEYKAIVDEREGAVQAMNPMRMKTFPAISCISPK